MGNELFAVDGVDVAALVAEHLGPRVLPATLIKPGIPGEGEDPPSRDPDNPTGGLSEDVPEPVEYACRGFIEDFRPSAVDGTLIKVGDRKVILLANTIEGGVEPVGGVDQDQVAIEGTRYNVWRVLDRDPAGATFTLQVRT